MAEDIPVLPAFPSGEDFAFDGRGNPEWRGRDFGVTAGALRRARAAGAEHDPGEAGENFRAWAKAWRGFIENKLQWQWTKIDQGYSLADIGIADEKGGGKAFFNEIMAKNVLGNLDQGWIYDIVNGRKKNFITSDTAVNDQWVPMTAADKSEVLQQEQHGNDQNAYLNRRAGTNGLDWLSRQEQFARPWLGESGQTPFGQSVTNGTIQQGPPGGLPASGLPGVPGPDNGFGFQGVQGGPFEFSLDNELLPTFGLTDPMAGAFPELFNGTFQKAFGQAGLEDPEIRNFAGGGFQFGADLPNIGATTTFKFGAPQNNFLPRPGLPTVSTSTPPAVPEPALPQVPLGGGIQNPWGRPGGRRDNRFPR